jgi:hypothetical protein
MTFVLPVTLGFPNIVSLLEVFNIEDRKKIVKCTLRMPLTFRDLDLGYRNYLTIAFTLDKLKMAKENFIS